MSLIYGELGVHMHVFISGVKMYLILIFVAAHVLLIRGYFLVLYYTKYNNNYYNYRDSFILVLPIYIYPVT